ncbi:hypothetical protein CNMCM6936_004608 [Aspergillus lentulus]|uniref:Urease accessory protein UreD, putative n=1 Tax=Aspergillus lentulus TaxID=293939 RepID=A0AAN6BK69_ASPLE|nr:hypothetical protein CNMCM6069_007786 [Aspergillus lentulus]KAF4159161.1 hypothetical protein CNMCM6936_004608 [Aspergillus lentulus]KAF4171400.1 hypothetical protein CNMCM8060_003049 [Aspergillus lentulus]KAF4177687.1 hypothetical protein CNMCM7927_002982 [Aspergillus lentulus]KAF4190861.1 hypothetical protein CNMCM8694_002850 [Aspergillus lentulus]
MPSPFESSVVSAAGHGKVALTLLPPSIPSFTTLSYKYPLKLLTHSPRFLPQLSALPCVSRPVHLYILSYGGGLLPGDEISVSIVLNPQTRLVISTPQGCNKIYRTEAASKARSRLAVPANGLNRMSRQILDVRIERQAALCYLPDSNVPFKDSRYEQTQVFTVDWATEVNNRSSLCVLDWVTEGRTALGEKWDFQLWRGKNEVWTVDGNGAKKLLLRDSSILDAESEDQAGETCTGTGLVRQRTGSNGIIGTLILYGPVFEKLAAFFMHRFQSQPRIGSQNWSSSSHKATSLPKDESGVVWTAARVRASFVMVKFGAKDVDGAKRWLGGLLREEGSIAAEFGEEALLCL